MFGATGWVGGKVTREAREHGHDVTAIVRDPSRLRVDHPKLTSVLGDAVNVSSISSTVRNHDAVFAAISGRREAKHEIVPEAARALLEALPQAGVRRLVWVGGAGSLWNSGVRLDNVILRI